jgi:O-6-methylguanine DNA methyltransferase
MKEITFKERVLKIVSIIAVGKTLSYKQVAQKAGSPMAYRAVGNILSQNFSSKIPCHRVICSNGSIGGYNRGRPRKKLLLMEEKAKICQKK